MDGLNAISSAVLPNPGSDWHVIAWPDARRRPKRATVVAPSTRPRRRDAVAASR